MKQKRCDVFIIIILAYMNKYNVSVKYLIIVKTIIER